MGWGGGENRNTIQHLCVCTREREIVKAVKQSGRDKYNHIKTERFIVRQR